MYKFKKIFLFLILVSSTVNAATRRDLSILPDNESIKKEDLNFGNALLTLNRELRFNGPTDYTLDVLEKTKTNPIFDVERNFFANIRKLKSKGLNFKEIAGLCYQHTQFNGPNPIKKNLSENYSKFCRDRFFETLAKEKISISSFSPKDEIYFRNSLSEEVKISNEKTVITVLDLASLKEDDHLKLTDFLIKIYRGLDQFPEKSILQKMKISPALTTFIQENGVMNTKDSEFFNNAIEEMFAEGKSHLKDKKYTQLITTGEHILSFYKSNEKYIQQEKVWKFFINTGYNLLYRDEREKAKAFYSNALLISKKSQKDDNYFYLIWADILNGKFKDAVTSIDKNDLINKFPNIDERTKFWVSYSFFKNDEISIARHLFKLITKNSPLSYYSILSLKHIDMIDNQTSPHGLVKHYQAESNIFNVSHDDFTHELRNSLTRLTIWNQLEYGSYAEQEVSAILYSPQTKILKNRDKYKHYSDEEIKRYLTSSLIQDFNKNGNYLQTFKLLYKSFDQNIFSVEARSLKFLFPFEYVEKIKKIDNSLDPLLVLSLIRQESAFNPDAKSHVGARGLMQLMPSTAKDFNSRVVASDLKTPETNLKIGMKYFKKLLGMFDGNLILSLASYNAGQNRVKYWVKNHFRTTDPLIMIESIPYDETRDYVKYIYRNLFFYNLLQNNNRLTLSLNESFKVNGF